MDALPLTPAILSKITLINRRTLCPRTRPLKETSSGFCRANDRGRTEETELAREQAHKVMKQIPVLGAVSWLMMQQAATRHTLLSELEWRVMPPLVLNQAKLFLRKKPAGRRHGQNSLRLQRRVSSKTHIIWIDLTGNPGEQILLIDLCAPFGGAQDVPEGFA